MPVNRRYKLVFVHIPKSAGSTVEKVVRRRTRTRWELTGKYNRLVKEQPEVASKLKRQNPARPNMKQGLMEHLTLSDIAAYLGKQQLAYYEKFCVVRNPWDRLVSYYEYGRQTGGRMNVGRKGFAEWFQDRPIRPKILPYLKISGELDASVTCLRFENFQAEFEEFLYQHGLGGRFHVHEKKTRRGDYRSYYSDDMAAALYQECREDIEYFGYRFD